MKEGEPLPVVSIVIPAKPGVDVAAVCHLKQLDYPPESVEVIVARGTAPSRQRNLAVRQASGEIVWFLDDDSRPLPDGLRRIAALMEDPSVDVVGGPSLTPDTDSVFQRGVAASLASLLGGGGVRNRYRSVGGVRECGDGELILCNLAIRRDRFLQQGGLDERLYPNEENELLGRISRGGGRLIHDPGLLVYRSQRETVGKFVRQMFTYGRGRGEQTRLTRRITPSAMIPSLFVIYLLLLPFCASIPLLLPLALYLVLLAASSFGTMVRQGVTVALLVLLLVPMIHLCYGAGVWVGSLAPRYRRRGADGEVGLQWVKTIGSGWKGP